MEMRQGRKGLKGCKPWKALSPKSTQSALAVLGNWRHPDCRPLYRFGPRIKVTYLSPFPYTGKKAVPPSLTGD